MLDILAQVFLVLLVIIGFASVIRFATFALLSPERGNEIYLVVPLQKDNDNAELQLRFAESRAKWFGGKTACRIIAVDYGMSEESRKICEFACRDNDCVKLCKAEELALILNNDLQNKHSCIY